MTLSIAIAGSHSIWLCTDMRLTYPSHVTDTATKCITLLEPDGVAYVGYCGLGSTPLGAEPSEWMARVLRGQPSRTVEGCLQRIAHVFKQEFPAQLSTIGAHAFHAVAVINGEPRIYCTNLETNADGRVRVHTPLSVLTHRKLRKPSWQGVRMDVIGSGRSWLLAHGKDLIRETKHLIKAYESGRIDSPVHVVRKLRQIIQAASRNDETVSYESRILGYSPLRGMTSCNNRGIPHVGHGFVSSQITALMDSLKDGEKIVLQGDAAREFLSRPAWQPDNRLR